MIVSIYDISWTYTYTFDSEAKFRSFQICTCLFVYDELNAFSDEDFCIQAMILKF